MFTRVLCAVDLSASAGSVMRHAAGVAHAAGASLVIVHVTKADEDARAAARDEVEREFLRAVPYEASYAIVPDIRVVIGERATAILTEAALTGADLIVAGTRGYGNLTGWVMASTTRLLMQATSVPLLLIPDDADEIVSLGTDRTHLHVGAVLAAVDPSELNAAQLAIASQLAALAHQPLVLMTVIPDGASVEDATAALRNVAHPMAPVRPYALIVRRGDVGREIARGAVAEGAGLVVMGLRSPGSGARPGAIATAVLETRRSIILAVPDVTPRPDAAESGAAIQDVPV